MEAAKKERKANFSDGEVKCLLEGIGSDRDVIMCKLANTLTNRNKKEAWGKILKAVNGCGVCLRSEDELKKKWKDLKSAALREQHDGTATGGGAPMKETPYKELIFAIIGDRSDVASGIDVDETDSYAAALKSTSSVKESLLDQGPDLVASSSRPTVGSGDHTGSFSLSPGPEYQEVSHARPASKLMLRKPMKTSRDIHAAAETTVGDGVTVDRVLGVAMLSSQIASTSAEKEPAAATDTSSNGARRFGRKRKGGLKAKSQAQSGTMDDSQLFDSWLSSEIEKNKSKMELMDLQKQKIRLEILKLKQEVFDPESVVLDCEM